MTKKIILILLSSFGFLHSEMSLASLPYDMHLSIIGGSGYSRVGSTQNLWLMTTPDPGLENTYTSSGKHSTNMLGFALEKTFLTKSNNLVSNFGIEMDYLQKSSLGGVVHPMVNVAPDFDTLNYSYAMQVYTLFATAKISKQNILPYLGVYLQGGIGSAFNKVFNYHETTPAGSSAAPMLYPFNDGSKSNFAYFIGAGFSLQAGQSGQVLIGYRYMNSGSVSMGRSPIQQTNDRLNFSLSHHFVTISLVV